MFLQIVEYLKIFLNTNLGYFLDDAESLLFIIFITGFIFVIPAYLLFQTRGAIIISIVISIPILFITIYALSWGKSDSNTTIMGFFSVLFVCIFIYGSYIYFSKEVAFFFDPKPAPFKTLTLVYMIVFFTFPIGYFLNTFIKEAKRAIQLVSMDVQISYDFRYPVFVSELKFINSKNNITKEYAHIKGIAGPNKFITKNLYSKLSIKDRFLKKKVILHEGSRSGLSPRSDRHKYQIPLGTDKFILSWYSYIEDKYYSDEFPFSYSQMKIHTGYNLAYDRYTKKIRTPVTIHLWPDGNASLFQHSASVIRTISGQKVITNFNKVATEQIQVLQKKNFIDYILKYTEFEGSRLELQSQLNQLKKDEIDNILLDRIIFYNWTISISDLFNPNSDTNNNVRFVNSHYDHIKTVTGGNYRSSLPQAIIFRRDNKEYSIYLDMIRLSSLVTKYIQPTDKPLGEPSIRFEIEYNKEKYTESKVNLIMNDKKFKFEDWQIEIEYNWDV